MTQDEINNIARALDLLGMALVKHKHVWTPEEREAYDYAICAIFSEELLLRAT